MALKVVMDTNIVVCTRGRLLQGPDMEAIESVRQKLALTLVLPAIVKAEAVNLYREDLHKRVGELRKNWQSLSDILPLGAGPLGADFSEEKAVRAYEESLTRRLDEIEAECPAYDGVSHEWIVDRILKRRKPFNEKTGAGYRDALLWRAVLECAAEGHHKTVLLSNNANDFAASGSRDQLHDHLVADLADRGIDIGTVEFCSSLKSFVAKFVHPSLELVSFTDQILHDQCPFFSLDSFIEDQHENMLERIKSNATLDDATLSRLIGENVSGARITEIDRNLRE